MNYHSWMIAVKTGKIDKYKGLELFLMRMGGRNHGINERII